VRVKVGKERKKKLEAYWQRLKKLVRKPEGHFMHWEMFGGG